MGNTLARNNLFTKHVVDDQSNFLAQIALSGFTIVVLVAFFVISVLHPSGERTTTLSALYGDDAAPSSVWATQGDYFKDTIVNVRLKGENEAAASCTCACSLHTTYVFSASDPACVSEVENYNKALSGPLGFNAGNSMFVCAGGTRARGSLAQFNGMLLFQSDASLDTCDTTTDDLFPAFSVVSAEGEDISLPELSLRVPFEYASRVTLQWRMRVGMEGRTKQLTVTDVSLLDTRSLLSNLRQRGAQFSSYSDAVFTSVANRSFAGAVLFVVSPEVVVDTEIHFVLLALCRTGGMVPFLLCLCSLLLLLIDKTTRSKVRAIEKCEPDFSIPSTPVQALGPLHEDGEEEEDMIDSRKGQKKPNQSPNGYSTPLQTVVRVNKQGKIETEDAAIMRVREFD